MKVPSQYLPVMPYLILKSSKDFHEFAKNVFSAKDQLVVPDESGDIMHGEIKIGDAVIMFAGATDTWKEKSAGMFLYVESVDDVFKKALKAGAKKLMAPEQKDYGYTAGFEDSWGNQWWIVEGEN